MLINQAKGIHAAIEFSTLRELNNMIKELQESLLNYKYDNEVDEIKEYEIYKIYKLIQHGDIFDMKYKDIPNYIQKIINILEFIEI